ncbi:MAG: hypothetical protein J7623_19615 [Chitinophaga sp.]|uniref:hypothetical protein n=1 Tax=Chitinophaga sp. TaxID=1869181 RepID=UPI001B1C894C|nr:hypothetical protein [Chitinophaga sp.]MBO9730857.1 hypothetical protein [Chitinophaga sp.]
MKQLLLLMVTLLLCAFTIHAQHQHHMSVKDTVLPHKHIRNTVMGDKQPDQGMQDTGMSMEAPMSHAFSLQLPMNRNGSGTGWLPDSAPMYGYMMHSKKWMYMVHGNLFLRYTSQDVGRKGNRGDSRFDAPNWFMLMAQRKIGKKGLFHYNVMMSLDRLTEGGRGYPLLFQSGESWQGKPLVDRQHPHDLFSELSVSYSYAFSRKVDAFVYFGYPGEPAIGSVAFMHRPSALSNPDAPVSHHWNDGTHITFGVATLGVRVDKFKLEGSVFTGREPDENRYNFDQMKFDSWSGRVSFAPSPYWTLQVSHGYIKSPEMLHPEEDIHRTTAAAIFNLPLHHDNWINATALWGLNKPTDHSGEHAVLIEGALRLKKTEIYTRYEWVQKSVEELALDPGKYGASTLFPVHALTAGLSYDLLQVARTRLALGGQFGAFFNDRQLDDLYGRNPIALQVYLRLYPGLMKMKHP